jgi:hypothetical protein
VKHTTMVILCCLGCLCLAVTGCGAASKSSTSKADFLSAANALCTGQARAHHLDIRYEEFGHQPADGELPLLSKRVFQVTQTELAKLRSLLEPRANRRALSAIWAARSAELNDAYYVISTYRSYTVHSRPGFPRKRVEYRSKGGFSSALRYQRLADSYGLKACATLQPTPFGNTEMSNSSLNLLTGS